MVAVELQLAGLVGSRQHAEEQPAEQAGQDPHGQEEVRPARDPPRCISHSPPPGTIMCTCG